MTETTSSTSLQRGMKPDVAKRRIASFGKRFKQPHLYFAYHAAFPLALTPDLLYRLWANFPRNIHGEPLKIPWVAVADLLLSTFCDEIGHELYEMDMTVRAELLKALKASPDFGQQRIDELSNFLLDYVQQQLNSSDPDIHAFAQAQEWTALAYVKPGKAANKLLEALSALDWNDRAEQVRMASLIETLVEQLEGFTPLLVYARDLAHFARGEMESAEVEPSTIIEQEQSTEVLGVDLPILTHIPCAPTTNIGERLVRHFLLTRLSGSYGILLTNYHLHVGNRTYEYDVVLINGWGVWTLEIKNWRGHILADQIFWQREDGRREHSPITSVEIKAKALASTLRGAGFTNISVVGMVVLTNSAAHLDITDPRGHEVFRPNTQLIEAVSGPRFLFRPSNKRLTAEQIQQIADTLLRRTVDPEQKIIGNYRLLRDLGIGEGFHVYEAEHITFADRRARIKKYHITKVISEAELLEAERRFKQGMLALIKVDNHPNIVRAYDFLIDLDSDDTYWLILEWIDGITLEDKLGYERAITFEEQLQILRALATALEHCHKKGILHRNLNPASIYLAEDGTVKLGDFDFAYVPGPVKTISKAGAPLLVNRYTAPELRINARNADVRSDLYALGAIWYDMVVRPTPNEPILISRLTEAALPDDALDLLSRLLEYLPHNRPSSAQEVKDWLQRLSP